MAERPSGLPDRAWNTSSPGGYYIAPMWRSRQEGMRLIPRTRQAEGYRSRPLPVPTMLLQGIDSGVSWRACGWIGAIP
jgi:hypothetical protein